MASLLRSSSSEEEEEGQQPSRTIVVKEESTEEEVPFSISSATTTPSTTPGPSTEFALIKPAPKELAAESPPAKRVKLEATGAIELTMKKESSVLQTGTPPHVQYPSSPSLMAPALTHPATFMVPTPHQSLPTSMLPQQALPSTYLPRGFFLPPPPPPQQPSYPPMSSYLLSPGGIFIPSPQSQFGIPSTPLLVTGGPLSAFTLPIASVQPIPSSTLGSPPVSQMVASAEAPVTTVQTPVAVPAPPTTSKAGTSSGTGAEAASVTIARAKTYRKARFVFTEEQSRGLEEHFLRQSYLGTFEREQISKELNIPDDVIKTWWQNRRMREKRGQQPSGSGE